MHSWHKLSIAGINIFLQKLKISMLEEFIHLYLNLFTYNQGTMVKGLKMINVSF